MKATILETHCKISENSKIVQICFNSVLTISYEHDSHALKSLKLTDFMRVKPLTSLLRSLSYKINLVLKKSQNI